MSLEFFKKNTNWEIRFQIFSTKANKLNLYAQSHPAPRTPNRFRNEELYGPGLQSPIRTAVTKLASH